MERVSVFVDGSNFYFGLKRNNRTMRVDYHRLSLALTGGDRKLVRTYYYNGAYDPAQSPDKARAQRPFFDSLERTPQIEMRLGRLVVNREGVAQEKGVGIKLASDLVYHAAQDHFDTAIVVTESQEFAPVLHLVKELGKCVELALFHDAQPRELVKSADRVLSLDELLNKHSAEIFVTAPAEVAAESQVPAPQAEAPPPAAPSPVAPPPAKQKVAYDEDEDSTPQPLNSASGIIQRLFGSHPPSPGGNTKPRQPDNRRNKFNHNR